MTENVEKALDEAIAFEERGSAQYQASTRESAAVPIRSLLLSILNQKGKRVARLREYRASCRAASPEAAAVDLEPLPPMEPKGILSDQFAVLDYVVLNERALQERYSRLAEALRFDEEGSTLLLALSEEAKKHASWAQDHLDLLTLA